MKKILIALAAAFTVTACIPIEAHHRYERARAIENHELRVPIWRQHPSGYVYRACQWRQDRLVRYQGRWWCTHRRNIDRIHYRGF